MPKPERFQADFFNQNPQAESVMRLFDALPNCHFYAKDKQSRFIKVNHAFLALHGLKHEREALGRTDRDFHPPVMAEAYIAEDQRVMQSREMLPGQVWMVMEKRQVPHWYVSSKIPLFDPAGEVIGITGAMYRIEQPQEMENYFRELLPVVQYIEQHYSTSISMASMAELAGLSSTHFNRRFKQIIRMTPLNYLRKVRVQEASRLLTLTSRDLSDIALEVGFADQSHFTKKFREVTGLTPSAYRSRFRV